MDLCGETMRMNVCRLVGLRRIKFERLNLLAKGRYLLLHTNIFFFFEHIISLKRYVGNQKVTF